MTDKLYNWLQQHFIRDNHSKYKHLFDTWVKNITPNQIAGFKQDMHLEEIFKLGINDSKRVTESL